MNIEFLRTASMSGGRANLTDFSLALKYVLEKEEKDWKK